MAGRGALRAEVLARLDQTAAEELLPEPVDRHAGDQRVGRIDQPAGQPEAVGRQLVAHRMQRAGRVRRTCARRAR